MTTKQYVKLNQRQLMRLKRLLEMEYTPAELAGEIGIDVGRVWRCFINAGCPHRRDDDNRIWIVGSEFRSWVNETLLEQRHPMMNNEAWCMKCNRPVVMVGPFCVIEQPNTELVSGFCSICGGKVNRARAKGDVD